MSRHCPVHLCFGTVRSGQLMCRDCWHAVPAELRRAVNRTWREFNKRPDGLSPDDTMALIRAYRTARDGAIAAAVEARP